MSEDDKAPRASESKEPPAEEVARTPGNQARLNYLKGLADWADIYNKTIGDAILNESTQNAAKNLAELWASDLGRSGSIADSYAKLVQQEAHQRNEISRLASAISETISKLRQESAKGRAEAQREAEQLRVQVAEYRRELRLQTLLRCVGPAGRDYLYQSEKFQEEFLKPEMRPAFVMSVDIRKSTDLMLKARTPRAFAQFLTTLCRRMESVVKSNFGVFDKFTGDGILAFFPVFYSGEDAGYYALTAAAQCHEIFEETYRESRESFLAVPRGAGLGIGIDFGQVHIVDVADALTVVGPPVVYACRLGSAPRGTTLLNQPAFEQVSSRFGGHFLIQEAELDVKHEGPILAYSVNGGTSSFKPSPPSWSVNSGSQLTPGSGESHPPAARAKRPKAGNEE